LLLIKLSKTALFYSPVGGNVNRVTIKLGEMIGHDKVDIIPVNETGKGDVDKYNQIILVGSTVGADHWNNETIVDEWTTFFEKIKDIGFERKKVAIVGLGNSVLYPVHFADGMALLYKEVKKRNAEIFGFVDAKDYDFTDSEAVNDEGFFCGLAIDEDNEAERTTERLEKWINILKPDWNIKLGWPSHTSKSIF
jgi:flavodoxin I